MFDKKKIFFCYFYFMLFVSIGLKLDLNFICYNNDKYQYFNYYKINNELLF